MQNRVGLAEKLGVVTPELSGLHIVAQPMRHSTSLAVVMVLSLSACATFWPGTDPRPETAGPTRPGSTVPTAAVPSIPETARDLEQDAPLPSRKVVKAKEAKSALIAHDGTRCHVTERRYRETVVGEKVWCVWQ
jgi:hypothetical protein